MAEESSWVCESTGPLLPTCLAGGFTCYFPAISMIFSVHVAFSYQTAHHPYAQHPGIQQISRNSGGDLESLLCPDPLTMLPSFLLDHPCQCGRTSLLVAILKLSFQIEPQFLLVLEPHKYMKNSRISPLSLEESLSVLHFLFLPRSLHQNFSRASALTFWAG